LITGFPGETEKDFQSSLNLVKTSLFNKLKVFNYSDRQGTPSSQMAGKISEKEKDRRKSALISTHLLQLASRLDLKGILLNLGSYY
jgi:ribosomal protein S12 methylthiotransferase